MVMYNTGQALVVYTIKITRPQVITLHISLTLTMFKIFCQKMFYWKIYMRKILRTLVLKPESLKKYLSRYSMLIKLFAILMNQHLKYADI
jgi:hypothetical protein